jgi:hypothetical protein
MVQITADDVQEAAMRYGMDNQLMANAQHHPCQKKHQVNDPFNALPI